MSNGYRNTKRLALTLGPLGLALALLACSLFSPTTPGPVASVEVPAGETSTIESVTQAPPPATVPPEPKVVVFDAGSFLTYSLQGDLIATLPASGIEYMNPGLAQAVADGVYYIDGQRHMVVKLSATGSQPGAQLPGDKERHKVSCTWRPSMVPAPRW
jgi:hypothetical protein